jgi:hypothetical protein
MMRPAGTGQLRVPEMEAFQKALPGLMQSDEGRRKAYGFLQAYYGSIVNDAALGQQYFHRQIPNPQNPSGPTIPAYNMTGYWDQPQLKAGVLPHYTGDMADGQAYNNWLAEQQSTPGKVYWEWKNVVDKKGNQVYLPNGKKRMQEVLGISPLEGE